jgi:hypothetical protein
MNTIDAELIQQSFQRWKMPLKKKKKEKKKEISGHKAKNKVRKW